MRRRSIVPSSVLGVAAALALACSPSPDQLKRTLDEHPEILLEFIEKHPQETIAALNKAAQAAQLLQQEQQQRKLIDERESEFQNPRQAVIEDGRAILGSSDAPITIVEYSDFECPFCERGYRTLREVKAKYGDKVRLVYKHHPLDFHPLALPAARYFEALALQNSAFAYAFRDALMENQGELKSRREDFLREAALGTGADADRLKRDLESELVRQRIQADMAEAKRLGFEGTPGYLINGVSIYGAYGAEVFSQIIERHLQDLDE